MDNKYYVYIYLHSDGTPYYVGKGCGNRWCAKAGHPDNIPPLSRVWFPVKDTTEEWALYCEMEYIDLYGRLDDGTGILENRTDGGDNPPKGTTESGKKAAISIKKYYENNPDKRLEANKNISIGKKKKAHITSQQVKERHSRGNFYTKEGRQKQVDTCIRNNEKKTKKIKDLNTDKEWMGTRKCAADLKISRNTIKKMCQGELDEYKGYKLRYAN